MRGWVHHIDLTVSDLARSGPFYDAVLSFLGYRQGHKGETWLIGICALRAAHRQSESSWQETIGDTIATPADFTT
jgi:hypothetical protein